MPYEDIEIFEKKLDEICVMVYEIEDDMIVLSKEGKYEYQHNEFVYLLVDYYDDADDIEAKKHIMYI